MFKLCEMGVSGVVFNVKTGFFGISAVVDGVRSGYVRVVSDVTQGSDLVICWF